jgi:ATP-dependent exoDNAse (exonuclease V) alpha subunit
MAFFHLNVKIISRSKGQYAVAAAAYRAGTKLYCQTSGQTFDYRCKTDVHRLGALKPSILAPSWAPDWVDNREILYNAVERIEKRKDAQLLREFDLAIPRELSNEEARLLVFGWNRENFLVHDLVSDVCFHTGHMGLNPHAHVLVTMRRIEPTGFAARKARDLNHPSLCERWRESWERLCNEALQAAGVSERISRLSLEAQGISRLPQRHVGRAVTAMRRRGLLCEEDYKRLLYRLGGSHGKNSRAVTANLLNSWRHLSDGHRLDATLGGRLQRLASSTNQGREPS